jgi:transposase InsO family protein
LAIYSPFLETQLHTDASSGGYGAILLQRQLDDRLFHPVSFFSRKTTEAESRLHSFELEVLAVVYSLQRFRVYLFGMHFTLVTDCKSMKLTLEKRDINPKIARWSMFLENFDFEIVHRIGEKMQHVDALSRVEVLTIESSDLNLFENTICINQLRDSNISKLKTQIERNEIKGYEIRDGIVYRVANKKLLLYIPDSMIPSVLFKYHNDMGHFGVDKTCDMIKRLFYFPRMRERVLEHSKSCIECIHFNPNDRKLDGYLKVPEKPDKPFQMIHIDHLGPLNKTRRNNLHLLVVVDAFTKFIAFYPTKTTNTREVVKHLTDYFHDYSVPRKITSDRGSAFTSKEFGKFINEYGIVHILNATASPQSNGQVERYNRTLVPVLAKLCEIRKKEWDLLLFDTKFLLNNTLNRSINDYPSRLLFGVVQKLKIEQNLIAYVESLNTASDESLEEIREKAYNNIRKVQDYNKEQYDKRCFRNSKYSVGDLVMIRNTKVVGENHKLKPKYKGPYVVKKVFENDRYLLTDLDGYQNSERRFSGVFDPRNMRLYDKDKKSGEDNDNSDNDNLSEISYQDVEYLEDEFLE